MDRTDGIDELYTNIKQIKQRMETLENENLVLKAQLTQAQRELADLRRGVGITLLIDGQPIAPIALPDVLPTPVAALHTRAPAGQPGLFTPPANHPPQPPSPGALFGPQREARSTRPDAARPNDWLS